MPAPAPPPSAAKDTPECPADLQPAPGGQPSLDQVLSETRAWVQHAVIGLNLCPFAKAVELKGLMRCVATEATDTESLAEALLAELQWLAATPADETETTLLVAPRTMVDFLDFNDFLGLADDMLAELGLEGEIQVASFHPQYAFADAPDDDITHATNRSPWPTLHLLRESSIDRAVASVPDTDAIYLNNQDTLRRLGPEGWAALQAQIKR